MRKVVDKARGGVCESGHFDLQASRIERQIRKGLPRRVVLREIEQQDIEVTQSQTSDACLPTRK